MLCGELVRGPQLGLLGGGSGSLSLDPRCRSPYFSVLAIVQGMAALTQPAPPVDDEDIFLENGLLSYENPNYHLDPARLDDALNSNTEEDPLYQELLEAVCQLGGTGGTGPTRGMPQGTVAPRGVPQQQPQRRSYAHLDINSMGVDVTTGPLTNLDTKNHIIRGQLDNSGAQQHGGNVNRGARRPLDLTASLRPAKPDLIETAQHKTRDKCLYDKQQPGVVTHIQAGLNDDLYAVPNKLRSKDRGGGGGGGGEEDTNKRDEEEEEDEEDEEEEEPPSSPTDTDLPAGWEKHEDNDGPYYWHIKSGTIQRDPPESALDEPRTPLVKDAETVLTSYQQTGVVSLVTRSNTSSALDLELEGKKKEERKEELALKRRSYPARAEPEYKERPIRFAVRSLGWVEIGEDDLTPERSSKAVNKCIVDLSLGRNDLIDNVGRWGDGKELFMDLDEGALKLIDPENLTTLNTQPIHTIRVWGVGRDNGRDFAYVARDRTTRKHMCHVFRCDIPARTIANTLRDICKKIMIERSLQQNLAKPIDINGSSMTGRSGLATRPTNLPTEHRRSHHRTGQTLVTESFPTPMEEPRKTLRAEYVGQTQVSRAAGMDVLNEAIDQMVTSVAHDQWKQVTVAVAPSMITILQADDESKIVAECRVRYLSFLGIGRNVKQCAFVMHTAQDLFIAHVFHCQPSSGALCKTIEAACKLRYQKCLDAHPHDRAVRGAGGAGGAAGGKGGIGATLKSLVGSLTGRKGKGGLES